MKGKENKMNQGVDVIELTRDCDAVQIPAGHKVKLVKGTKATITQSLGGTYTIHVPSNGGLFQLSGHDADALGKKDQDLKGSDGSETDRLPENFEALEKMVWDRLKTCYDPEIPVNIVDLGLVYELKVTQIPEGQARVDMKMTLTAQGCGMGRAIAGDAKSKLLKLPGVTEANVELVWDPPWSRERISPEGKAKLGIQ
jgi:probable FeS assembly SUF system protein SufT